MDYKLCNRIFFSVSFLLIFNNIATILQLNFLGPLSGNVSFYFIVIGMIWTVYYQYRYKNIFIDFNIVKKYIGIFLGITFISLLIGLYSYPYYDLIINGPITQIEKLPKVLAILNEFNINIDEKFLISIWMIVRTIKTLLLEIISTFCVSYMIYCWYYQDWEKGFNVLLKAVKYSLIVIFIYGFIEVFYLAGNEFATTILINITPIFHSVTVNNSWWPPLLWDEQLRSIFAEPSYFGIYATFAMPLLWFKLFSEKTKKLLYIYSGCLAIYTFFLFLTKARTALALFSGELFILFLYIVILHNKELVKKFLLICTCVLISFVSANFFIYNIMNSSQSNNVKLNIESYVDDNLGSIASTEKRSNKARYSIMAANLKIGLDNPLLGVGSNLRHAYIPYYLPDMSKNSGEVNMWLERQKKYGILKAMFPNLGEYTTRFAETGLLGLIAFLIPPIILIRKLLKITLDKRLDYKKRLPYICITISFMGIMASGIGDSINITYCYWILLGFGFAMCFGKNKIN